MNNIVRCKIVAACAMTMLASMNVNAASCFGDPSGYCLTDGNASFSIDSNGLMEMTVDGITHVYTTDFLVDFTTAKGPDVPASSFVDYMDLGQAPGATPYSILSLNNLAVGNWGAINLTFELIGGTAGSNYAEIRETFSFTNISGGTQTFSMVAYTDVDLGGKNLVPGTGQPEAFNDQGALQSWDTNGQPTSFLQWDNNYQLLASVGELEAPDNYEVGIGTECFGDLCEKVYFDKTTSLTNTVASGPGDLQMAAQWIRQLANNEVFNYTQSMVLCEFNNCPVPDVPVPAAVWLFGSGLLGLIGVARRRKA